VNLPEKSFLLKFQEPIPSGPFRHSVAVRTTGNTFASAAAGTKPVPEVSTEAPDNDPNGQSPHTIPS